MTKETTALLESFGQAWNSHDIDAMMALMAADCEFVASAGPQRDGERHVGRAAVRKAYQAILEDIPDARWRAFGVFVTGDTAFSLWNLMGTRRDGTVVDVDGIDHFVIENNLIKTKNAFRKARQSVHHDEQSAARP